MNDRLVVGVQAHAVGPGAVAVQEAVVVPAPHGLDSPLDLQQGRRPRDGLVDRAGVVVGHALVAVGGRQSGLQVAEPRLLLLPGCGVPQLDKVPISEVCREKRLLVEQNPAVRKFDGVHCVVLAETAAPD
jgi:hypothetical protein